MRRLVPKIISFLGVLFAVLFVSEILLRIFWKPDFLNPNLKRDDFSWVSNNVILDHFGYRDREFNLLKPKDTYRIYVLGDSYTYGWYIDDYLNAFPKVLEKTLFDSNPNKKVEVINASKPGFNFKAEIDRLKNEGVLFQPDYVMVGINLLDFAAKEYPPKFAKNRFIWNLRLYQLTLGNFERSRVSKLTYRDVLITYKEGSAEYKKVKDSLSEMKSLTDLVGAHLLVVVFPQYNPSSPNSSYRFVNYHDAISRMGKELNIEVADLKGPFDEVEDKKQLVLNPTDPHPSQLADEIAGRFIAGKIAIPNKFSNFKTKTMAVRLGSFIADNPEIISIKPQPWVYFNRQFGIDPQQLLLPEDSRVKMTFLENVLKTVKYSTHDGWPGAKLEYNIAFPGNTVFLPGDLYGYPAIGVSQAKVFWREDGNQQSRDLDLDSIEITKDGNGIKVVLNVPNLKLDFVRFTLDLDVRQFDIENGKVVSVFSTSNKKIVFENGKAEAVIAGKGVYSLPAYYSGTKKYGYLWLGEKEVKCSIIRDGNSLIIGLSKERALVGGVAELYYAGDYAFQGGDYPEVIYFSR